MKKRRTREVERTTKKALRAMAWNAGMSVGRGSHFSTEAARAACRLLAEGGRTSWRRDVVLGLLEAIDLGERHHQMADQRHAVIESDLILEINELRDGFDRHAGPMGGPLKIPAARGRMADALGRIDALIAPGLN